MACGKSLDCKGGDREGYWRGGYSEVLRVRGVVTVGGFSGVFEELEASPREGGYSGGSARRRNAQRSHCERRHLRYYSYKLLTHFRVNAIFFFLLRNSVLVLEHARTHVACDY